MTASGTRTTTYALAATALAALAAGCGSSSSGSGTASVAQSASVAASAAGGASASNAPAAAASSAAAGTAPAASATTTHVTSIGKVLADTSGRTIYELVGDTASNAACTGSCESIWPPVKSGGKILVIHGHPAFTFTGDSKAGQANGEGSKDTWGTWLALRPNGVAIPFTPAAAVSTPKAAPTPTATKSASSGGGGYGY